MYSESLACLVGAWLASCRDRVSALALVAQGIEHGSPKAGVVGSNPIGRTQCGDCRTGVTQFVGIIR